MFFFVKPHLDGTVSNVMIGGDTLADAFDTFRRYHWLPSTPGAIAVFHNHCLCGRVIPVQGVDNGENVPLLQEWR